MGTIKHHSIIVTGFDKIQINIVRTKAIELFTIENYDISDHSNLVSNILFGMNGYMSFFIAPDGSKEGWSDSDFCDNVRAEFIKWMDDNQKDICCDYIEIKFGGDDNYSKIEKVNY